MKNHFILLTALSSLIAVILSKELKSLVVSAPEASTRIKRSIQQDEDDNDTMVINPQIYSFKIHADIIHRYATTLITSKVRNLNQTAEQTTFTVILPEAAFISSFSMEIDGETYKAQVEEKQEAKNIYDEAVSKGRSAAHVSATNSTTFMVSVNIEPRSKASFELRYEELLRRELGHFKYVVNISPGQLVEDMDVEVSIRESKHVSLKTVPTLRTGKDVMILEPSVDVRSTSWTSAFVKFHPDRALQKRIASLIGTKKEYDGLAGQFVVEYDVIRDPRRGEVLVRDGYFVHFFAPVVLYRLPKHLVFVLDYSASMSKQKLHQLVDAMKRILSKLNDNDLFSIVQLQSWTSVLDVTGNRFVNIQLDKPNYGHLETRLRRLNLPNAARATPQNIVKATKLLEMNTELGTTNIIEGLELGLFLVKRAREKDRRQAMMIFLTDGLPNLGMVSEDEIIETVTKLNNGDTPIFSLSFGEDADKSFLEELSLKNFGFCTHIYEAADAPLQLQHFYHKISSAMLSNVTFKYVGGGVRDVTQNNYPLYFEGSELVVAGRINDKEYTSFDIYGVSGAGFVNFTSVEVEAVDSIERLWAYLTVRQLLHSKNNSTELTKRALDLSLKYSFVTELTSLIVVKPSPDEKEVGIALDPDFKSIKSGGSNFFSSFILPQLFCCFNGILFILYFTRY